MHIVYFVGGPWDCTKRAYKTLPNTIQVHQLVDDEPSPDQFVISKITNYSISPIPVYWNDEQYFVGIYEHV